MSSAPSFPGWTHHLLEAAGVQAGEHVLVVVDPPIAEQGDHLVGAAELRGATTALEIWEGVAPVEAGTRADVCLFLARHPKPHEGAERFKLAQSVTGHGGREIYMGLVDKDLLEGELSETPPDLTGNATKLLAQVQGASEIRITGAAGTDLTLRIEGRNWNNDTGVLEAGHFANFPNGEIYIAPLRDGTDGVLVADLTVPYTVEGLVDEPVTLRFTAGRVTSIEGGRAADMLRAIVEEAGTGADVIAELGIGFNPAVIPRGHVMLDEKAARTAHVAIGRNTGTYGGDNEAKIHVDCIFSEPTVWADGQLVELPA